MSEELVPILVSGRAVLDGRSVAPAPLDERTVASEDLDLGHRGTLDGLVTLVDGSITDVAQPAVAPLMATGAR